MKKLVAIAAFAAVPFTAYAADYPYVKSGPVIYAAPPIFCWTGFYLGATVGVDANDSDWSGRGSGRLGTRNTLTGSGTGVIGGFEVGYNYQIAAYVLGFETDYSFDNADATITASGHDVVGSSKMTALGTIRGRAGYAVDRVLLFVTGGFAYGSVTSAFTDNAGASGYAAANSTHVGWAAGGGVEYALSSEWTVKGEGLYYDLDKQKHGDSLGGNVADSYDNEPSGVVGRLGINYKF